MLQDNLINGNVLVDLFVVDGEFNLEFIFEVSSLILTLLFQEGIVVLVVLQRTEILE